MHITRQVCSQFDEKPEIKHMAVASCTDRKSITCLWRTPRGLESVRLNLCVFRFIQLMACGIGQTGHFSPPKTDNCQQIGKAPPCGVDRRRPQVFHQCQNGERWGQSHQQRPFNDACAKAQMGPKTFHELRHTYASRMVEKHYGHLAPSYIADTIRATFSTMGVVPETNVLPLTSGKWSRNVRIHPPTLDATPVTPYIT